MLFYTRKKWNIVLFHRRPINITVPVILEEKKTSTKHLKVKSL